MREEISTAWLGFNSYATLWHQQVRVPYGRRFAAGDIVSVLLDYGKRRIAFYVNHEFINVASREAGLLMRKLHFAATLAYEGDQLTLLPPLQSPPRQQRAENDDEEEDDDGNDDDEGNEEAAVEEELDGADDGEAPPVDQSNNDDAHLNVEE